MKIKKPQLKHINKKSYVWHEIEEYIAIKYKKSLRDWSGMFEKDYNKNVEYQDFWHTIIDMCEIHNGCYFEISLSQEDYKKDFEKEIVKLLKKEFKKNYLYCWVSW